MALTRPTLAQLTTGIARIGDPITTLHAGYNSANVDIGFLMNRANGIVSNVALYWNESGNTFVTAFTGNTGETNSNIAVTSYATVTTGHHLPGANVTYSLGSTTQRWKDLWLAGTTIYLGGATISSSDANTVTITNQNGGSFGVTGSAAGQATGTFGNLIASSGLASSSTSTGALQVSGGAGVTGAVYAGSVYDNGVRVVSTSANSGNLTITSGAINLNTIGPGAITAGSSTAIPVITTDIYGRVVALTTASITTSLSTAGTTGTGSVAIASQALTFAGTYGVTATAASQTITIATPQDLRTTAAPSFAGATMTGTLTLSSGLSAGGTTGTSGYVLSSTGTGVQWVAAGGFNGGTISGAVNINNSTASTSTTTGALTVAGGVGVVGDMWVGGTLTVANLQARGSTSIVVQDPMLYLQANVLYPWTYDTGVFSDSIGGPANTYVHHGMVRSTASSTWGFFSNVKSEPDTTINWADAGLVWDKVKTGDHIIANTTVSTSTSTGALQVAGGAGIVGALYAGSIYDSGNRVLSTSSGAGNLAISGTAITLPASGPGATSAGGASSVPVITTDMYGRFTSLSSIAVVAPASTLSGTTLSSGVTASSLTSVGTISTGTWNGTTISPTYGGTGVNNGANTLTLAASVTLNQSVRTSDAPTFAGGTFTANVVRSSRPLITNFTGETAPTSPIQGDEWFRASTGILYKYLYDSGTSTYNWVNINSALVNSSTSATANTIAVRDASADIYAATFRGIATSAKYADLAENYASDSDYEPGTVVVFGGEKEITVTTVSHDTRVAGVISTNPAYLMNSEMVGLPVAFTGRVPCRVQGPVTKGDVLVTSHIPGVARKLINSQYVPGCVIGKALENNETNNITTIEVVVGRF